MRTGIIKGFSGIALWALLYSCASQPPTAGATDQNREPLPRFPKIQPRPRSHSGRRLPSPSSGPAIPGGRPIKQLRCAKNHGRGDSGLPRRLRH